MFQTWTKVVNFEDGTVSSFDILILIEICLAYYLAITSRNYICGGVALCIDEKDL